MGSSDTPGADNQRTLIGALASHDSLAKNKSLAVTIRELWKADKALLSKFHFLFTQGTFRRVVLGDEGVQEERLPPLDKDLREFLLGNSTCLPGRRQGGVTVLANFVVNRQCRIIWPFLDPAEPHWLNQENLALMRLCDVFKVKRLMNVNSVLRWFESEAERDSTWSRQPTPLELRFPKGPHLPADASSTPYAQIRLDPTPDKPPRVIALIAHDDMKARMTDFAVAYEDELAKFERILATGTTGRAVSEACGRPLNVVYCRSGPKGGDIQIATEILAGRCKYVIFFVDPLHPQPHVEDIRVVFGACMISEDVRMLTNEVEAREWIEQAVRADRLDIPPLASRQG